MMPMTIMTSVLFFIFLKSPFFLHFVSSFGLLFLHVRDERSNHRVYNVGEEHLVDDKSDREDDDGREVRCDECKEEGVLKFSIKSKFFYEGKSTIGMDEDITFLYESEEYCEEKKYEYNREYECLENLSERTWGECHCNSTIHRNENREDEYEVYR